MGLVIEMGPASEGKPKGDDRARAGKMLAKAIKSGDGAAIADAFEELRACCDEAEMDDEEDDSE